eukprot:Clim_evm13s84 gene=Clim_evmTU13s84
MPPNTEMGQVQDATKVKQQVQEIFESAKKRSPNEPEFHQAAEEIMKDILPFLEQEPQYLDVLERLLEPERVIMFRVPWVDDQGKTHVNRGYRVQFNSAIGPYKGGLRFHPSVNLSILKFLGFEQIFKNSLTQLPMGGAKGGSDFDPKGRSDNEIMRFCQAFISELYKYIGPDRDVPAGDIGVGGAEIGYLFGMYKKIVGDFHGAVLTGKPADFGGSKMRPEATGYGATYFLADMINGKDGLYKTDALKDQTVAISGSGNVALFGADKVLDLGGKPVTVSDSKGTLYKADGFTADDINKLMELKFHKKGRLSELKPTIGVYHEGKTPWDVVQVATVAFPCATQNEINEEDALKLKDVGVKYVVEGANMPSTTEAIDFYDDHEIIFGPGKAANAGGVSVSGLEMSQNKHGIFWNAEKVDDELKRIMNDIYEASHGAAKKYSENEHNLRLGANIAGFAKVARAMKAQGVV